MIQRIQSLYLILVVALAVGLCWAPVGGVWVPGRVGYYALTLQGAVFQGAWTSTQLASATPDVLFSTIWLTAIPVLVAILAFITLLLFKKRILQVRLCVVNAVLCLGYYGMYFWYMFLLKAHVTQVCGSNDGMLFMWGLAFPLVCLILICMSARSILKDEALVRSLDRLR